MLRKDEHLWSEYNQRENETKLQKESAENFKNKN